MAPDKVGDNWDWDLKTKQLDCWGSNLCQEVRKWWKSGWTIWNVSEIWNEKDSSDLEGWTWEWFSLRNAMMANTVYIHLSFRECTRLLVLKTEDLGVLQLFSRKVSLCSGTEETT